MASLAVHLHSLREELGNDFLGTLKRIKDIGFDAVELCDFLEWEDRYRDALPEAALTPSSAHVAMVGRDVGPVFDAAERVGVTTLIEPQIDRELWTNRIGVQNSAARMNEIARIGADRGITVGYHNHWWEAEYRVDGAPSLAVFVDSLDDEVVLEVDPFWLEVGGISAANMLAQFGDRVRLIHVKDGSLTRDERDQVAVGSGNLDFPKILAAAPRAVRVVELDHFAGNVFEALQDSYRYLSASNRA
ncbi:MAG: sugar phosphate isomerase/epimerase [Microbacteriaceae bacterium]|nr:sugar phosphate isomerase/epimerase [Microbacteriaceae bacterium]